MAWPSRILLVGTTGSGKSHLARQLTRSAQRQGRVLVIDPAGSEGTQLPGARTIYDPAQADLTSRTLRFVPTDPYDLDVYDELYRWAWNARDAETGAPVPWWIWCDEAGMVIPARGAPRGAARVQVQGRKRSIAHLACHTRPRDIHRDLIAQASHVGIFALPNVDDRRHVAELAGIPAGDLEARMAELAPFEFLWWTVGTNDLIHCAALPR